MTIKEQRVILETTDDKGETVRTTYLHTQDPCTILVNSLIYGRGLIFYLAIKDESGEYVTLQ